MQNIYRKINIDALWFDVDQQNRLVVNTILFKEQLSVYSVYISLEADKHFMNKMYSDLVRMESSLELI